MSLATSVMVGSVRCGRSGTYVFPTRERAESFAAGLFDKYPVAGYGTSARITLRDVSAQFPQCAGALSWAVEYYVGHAD